MSDSVLAFALLDRHVIDGRGEKTACTDSLGSLTFARLLERSAAIAGGLAILGVKPGDPVDLDLPPGNDLVMAVCALTRLGAIPAAGGSAAERTAIGLVEGVPTVHFHEPAHEHSHELALVERAGRSDPIPAPLEDPVGYRDLVRGAFTDIVEPLLTGSPVV